MKIKRICSVIGSVILLCTLLTILAISCNNVPRNNSHPEITNASIKDGKSLAATYCQSCHALPDPAMLDSKTWEKGVLPAMGPRLGIFKWNNVYYPSSRYDVTLDRNYYPEKAAIAPEEWQSIIDYYIATAPDTIYPYQKNEPAVKSGLPSFNVKLPHFKYYEPAATLVNVISDSNQNGFLVSDAIKKTLYRFNKELEIVDSVKTNGPLVNLEWTSDEKLACDIGMLTPNNGKYGSARNVNMRGDKMSGRTPLLFDGLARPVQISAANLNKDSLTDYVVCEFGYLTGALSWMENKGAGKFTRHVLRNLSGAVKAIIQDYNSDGLPDLWVLMAQGEEGIFLYTNKGNGQFQERQILRFPPVYGSSYFEMVDFNNDGYQDIIYTCGDNADYSVILKPYHGVYIYLNDGKNNFKQQYFFHINGCYKAIAKDFDNDGDLDIATIAFFADFVNKPQESFVYLENRGQFNFSAYSFPEAQHGRWLTMDADDINGDGTTDIILGNFSMGPSLLRSKFNWKEGPPFIILDNISNRK